jgi:hypothetical protein
MFITANTNTSGTLTSAYSNGTVRWAYISTGLTFYRIVRGSVKPLTIRDMNYISGMRYSDLETLVSEYANA